MAMLVHLFLKINGSDVAGESAQASVGGVDVSKSIEVWNYASEVATAREAGSAMATGRRQHKPIIIKKRIDKSSPLIYKGLCLNQVVEAKFMFFKPHPENGQAQHFYTVELEKCRISHVNQGVEFTSTGDDGDQHPMEEVGFVFQNITWTYEEGGASHKDSWSGQE